MSPAIPTGGFRDNIPRKRCECLTDQVANSIGRFNLEVKFFYHVSLKVLVGWSLGKFEWCMKCVGWTVFSPRFSSAEIKTWHNPAGLSFAEVSSKIQI